MTPARLVLLAAALASAQTPLEFEVATIKPTTEQERVAGMFTYPGGRIVATNYSLKALIAEAYKISASLIEGGPKWAGEKRFSLTAQPPAESASSKINPSNIKLPPPDEELLMLRALLAERFHLIVHEETREGPVFALTVDDPKKLTPTKNKEAFPYLGMGQTGKPERPYWMAAENASMQLIATRLQGYVERPVIDQTGLDGTYDFRFECEYSNGMSSVTTSIKEAGLKLTPAKGPIRYLVIDRAEEPDEN